MTRAWFQVSLRTLLAMMLAFGLGLAVKHRFGKETTEKPDPWNIRRGDRLTVEFSGRGFTSLVKRTTEVLVDGCIRLPDLGQVPAAGLSLDELTQHLNEQLTASYSARHGTKIEVDVFVSFENTSVESVPSKQ